MQTGDGGRKLLEMPPATTDEQGAVRAKALAVGILLPVLGIATLVCVMMAGPDVPPAVRATLAGLTGLVTVLVARLGGRLIGRALRRR